MRRSDASNHDVKTKTKTKRNSTKAKTLACVLYRRVLEANDRKKENKKERKRKIEFVVACKAVCLVCFVLLRLRKICANFVGRELFNYCN